ncbi:MAG: hypothetical protein IH984_06925 [Planctomycetes bacterium]|nr:hypothetical protein [Planctomycetota bacterium]
MTQFNQNNRQGPIRNTRYPQNVEDDPLRYQPIFPPAREDLEQSENLNQEIRQLQQARLFHRLRNLFALAFIIFAVVLGLTHRSELNTFFFSMELIGPGHSPEEMTWGLIVFGLVLVSILAAMKIVLHGNQKNDR